MKLYEQIFAQLKPQAPLPDLVIYLQAPPDTLVERVLRRGNPIESGVSKRICARCRTATRAFFTVRRCAGAHRQHRNLNPIERADDFELLLSRSTKMRGRREYFNLAA